MRTTKHKYNLVPPDTSSTIKFTSAERSVLDRLRKKYGTVRNTVRIALENLHVAEFGQLPAGYPSPNATPEP